MQRGNQHGGRKYDDLQNCLDMTSHKNPLYWNPGTGTYLCLSILLCSSPYNDIEISQNWVTLYVPVLSNTGTFQYPGLKVYCSQTP